MVTLDIELFAISYCDTFGFFAICLLCIVRIRHRTAKLFVGSKHYINFFFQNRTIANIATAKIRTDRTHFRISSLQDHESTLFFLRSNIFSRSSLHSTNSSLAATTPCVFTGQNDPPRIPLFTLLGAEFPQKLLGDGIPAASRRRPPRRILPRTGLRPWPGAACIIRHGSKARFGVSMS